MQDTMRLTSQKPGRCLPRGAKGLGWHGLAGATSPVLQSTSLRASAQSPIAPPIHSSRFSIRPSPEPLSCNHPCAMNAAGEVCQPFPPHVGTAGRSCSGCINKTFLSLSVNAASRPRKIQ